MKLFVYLSLFIAISTCKGQTLIVDTLEEVNLIDEELVDVDLNPYETCCFPEQMPEFNGGQKALLNYLKENLIYPLNDNGKKMKGRVVLQFTITKDGRITKIESLKKDVDNKLVAEAIRLVNLMPPWTPAKCNGQYFEVKFTLPIVFK